MESTKPKPFCFILMPFDKTFDDIYKKGIKKACNEAGTYCERVDEQNYRGTILERIYNQISKADIIIADVSNRNANVFYEVGYAHALNKPTILLIQKAEDSPFDLRNYPHIIYQNSIQTILKELPNKIKWFIDNEVNHPQQYTLDIDLYLGKDSLSEKGVICNLNKSEYERGIDLTLINSSSRTYTADDFSISCFMVNQNIIIKQHGKNLDSSRMPDNCVFYHIPFTQKLLFPQMPYSINLSFVFPSMNGKIDSEIVFRIFSKIVTRDYYLVIEKHLRPPIQVF